MGQRTEITDLDLLAYADGRLDTQRAQAVADYLSRRPDLAEKVADFARQNEELRQHFGPVAEEPLPEHIDLLIAGEQPPRAGGRMRRWAPQAAAACLLMAATGTGGWWIGTLDQPGDTTMARFLDEAAGVHMAGAADGLVRAGGEEVADTQPMRWLSDKVSLELTLPDMQPNGYELVDQHLVAFEDTQGLMLEYHSADGEHLNVFMKTRWDDDGKGYQFASSGELTMAYWRQGPLAIAVAADSADRGKLGEVAQVFHDALAAERDDSAPALGPGTDAPGAQEAGVQSVVPDVSEPAIGVTNTSSDNF